MNRILFAAALFATSATAFATEQPKVDPTQQALVQMLSEAQSREANALVQVYALRAQVADLKARLEAETARAERAEARNPPADGAPPPAKRP